MINTNSTAEAIKRFMESTEGAAWLESAAKLPDIHDEVPPATMPTPGWVAGQEVWFDSDHVGVIHYGQTHGTFGEGGARLEQSFTYQVSQGDEEVGTLTLSAVRIEIGDTGPSLTPAEARELAYNLADAHDELKRYHLEHMTLGDISRWARDNGEDPHELVVDVLSGRRTTLKVA